MSSTLQHRINVDDDSTAWCCRFAPQMNIIVGLIALTKVYYKYFEDLSIITYVSKYEITWVKELENIPYPNFEKHDQEKFGKIKKMKNEKYLRLEN